MIFGNGFGSVEPIEEPQPTRSIFGDLFGLGPMLKMLTDPAMLASAQAMMAAITAGGEAAQRLEMKLDLLLRAQGHDVEQLNRDFAESAPSTEIMRSAQLAFGGVAALSDARSGFGDRAAPPASTPLDDGHREDASRDRSPPRSRGGK